MAGGAASVAPPPFWPSPLRRLYWSPPVAVTAVTAPRPIPKRAADAAILNEGLSRELTALDAYTRGNGLLRGRERALGRRLRAEEQEYVDALTKAIRGLGGDTEVEAETLDFSQVKDRAAFLALAYELESASRDFYVDQAARLYTAAPRTLDAWLAAGHGGHVALLPDGGG